MRMPSVSGLFRFFTFCVVAALVALSVGVAVADTEAASDSSSSTRKARANDLPIVIEARELLETIARLEVEFADLKADIKEAHEADGKAIAELQARRRLVAWMRAVEELVENVVEQQEQGLDASKIRQATRKILWSVDRRLPAFLDNVSAENADLREARAEASPESAIGRR